MSKPQVFAYHDYRLFLKDWLASQKAGQSTLSSNFSMGSFAKELGVSLGYLSMVVNGKRHLSHKVLIKLKSVISLTANEQSFLELLVELGTSTQAREKNHILQKMRRFKSYREQFPKEAEVHQYMTDWLNVAIREMAALPDFKPDAEWIRERLLFPADLKEIQRALDFLDAKKFITRTAEGGFHPPDWRVECMDEIHKVALTQFHKQFLGLAAASIEAVHRDERNIQGHCIAFDKATFSKANEILNEAFEKIRKLEPVSGNSDAIYFAELALYPLTRRSNKVEE